jgi:hypothetical protein
LVGAGQNLSGHLRSFAEIIARNGAKAQGDSR